MRYTETAGSWAESSFGHKAGQRQPWHFAGSLGGGQPGGGSQIWLSKSLSSSWTPEQVEEESEQMTDTFLSGGDNLDEFLEQYHEKRKLAHLRRVKVVHWSPITYLFEKYQPTKQFVPN